jgi:D-glycero-alpha-D-manno-heptose-7-phosphate kinase
MIISRAPVRITLGGGGTDLASYYSQFGGFLIAGAINKYVYVSANPRFYTSIRLSYSETEVVDKVEQIRHRIFREALAMLDIEQGIELVSIADVPSSCGLGTSGTFTVALLNALHAYKRSFVSQDQLAEEACTIEIERLGEPIGKQDQYASAYGGLSCFTFDKNGNVHVEPLLISDEQINTLENRILLFYTGQERHASDILREQKERTESDDAVVISRLHQIKEIGLETRRAFEAGDLDHFGELLHHHWETKRRLSSKVSDPRIEAWYETARKNGALGGKIMGAGGGGFFLFYCPENGREKLVDALLRSGLKPMRFRFDFEGAKIVANLRTY